LHLPFIWNIAIVERPKIDAVSFLIARLNVNVQFGLHSSTLKIRCIAGYPLRHRAEFDLSPTHHYSGGLGLAGKHIDENEVTWVKFAHICCMMEGNWGNGRTNVSVPGIDIDGTFGRDAKDFG
jgi:hypothetical protein